MTQERKITGASASSLLIAPGPRFVNHTRRFGVSTDPIADVPNGVQNGDILIMCFAAVAGGLTGNLVTPSGWTTIVNRQTNSSLCQSVVSWRVSDGSEPSTYTWDIGFNSRYQCCMMRWDNIFAAPGDFIGQVTNNGTPNQQTIVQSSITSTRDDSVLISTYGCLSSQNPDPGPGVPPPEHDNIVYAEQTTSGSDNTHIVGWEKIPTAAATGTRTWTQTNSLNAHSGGMFILQPHLGTLTEFDDVADVSQAQVVD